MEQELQQLLQKNWFQTGLEAMKAKLFLKRAMTLNHCKAKPIYPLLLFGYSKNKCMEILQEAGIEIPKMYKLGFRNNNCFKTGCVQGGIGYWQKIRDEYPEKFDAMAEMEHKLTSLKGRPVTMLRQQTTNEKNNLFF